MSKNVIVAALRAAHVHVLNGGHVSVGFFQSLKDKPLNPQLTVFGTIPGSSPGAVRGDIAWVEVFVFSTTRQAVDFARQSGPPFSHGGVTTTVLVRGRMGIVEIAAIPAAGSRLAMVTNALSAIPNQR